MTKNSAVLKEIDNETSKFENIKLGPTRNKTNVFLKTRWTRFGIAEPILIEPFTPMKELIAILENAANTKYNNRQIIELKQYYQKYKEKEGNLISKRKSCQGWYVEYLKNGSYKRVLTFGDISCLNTYILSKGHFLTNEFSPVIEIFKLPGEMTCEQVANELNQNIKNPNMKGLFNLVLKTLNKNNNSEKNLSKLIDSIQNILKQLKERSKEIQAITPEEVLEINSYPGKSIKGWYIKR